MSHSFTAQSATENHHTFEHATANRHRVQVERRPLHTHFPNSLPFRHLHATIGSVVMKKAQTLALSPLCITPAPTPPVSPESLQPIAYNSPMPASPRPITDSPWFWVCVFAAAALIGLALINSKYGQRQAQIEREFQGRQRAAQNVQGQSPNVPLSTPDQTMIPLWPLAFAFTVLIPIAWFIFWRRRSTPNHNSDP
jgi:hypothetical protein